MMECDTCYSDFKKTQVLTDENGHDSCPNCKSFFVKEKSYKIVLTDGIARMANNDKNFLILVNSSINKFMKEDYGDLCEEDKELNCDEDALGVYGKEIKEFWIKKEFDGKDYIITVLFPEEY